MAIKLKLDADGHVIVRNGKPVYEFDDGKEIEIDGNQLYSKVGELNKENQKFRETADAATKKLEAFGETDPAELNAFLDEVEALGGLEAIRKGSKVDVETVKAELSKAYDLKLADKDKVIADKDGHIYKLEVSNRFKSSKFINENLILPSDIAEATFGQNFKIEDGQVVAYLGANKIYSREKPGELADFDEAVQVIVDAYPMKDRILKGTGSSGGGSQGGGSSLPGTIKSRADLGDAKAKSAFIGEHGLDAFKALPEK